MERQDKPVHPDCILVPVQPDTILQMLCQIKGHSLLPSQARSECPHAERFPSQQCAGKVRLQHFHPVGCFVGPPRNPVSHPGPVDLWCRRSLLHLRLLLLV
eukprot:87120-Amphidinium_carterae.2